MTSMMPKRFWEGEFVNLALFFCGKSCIGVTSELFFFFFFFSFRKFKVHSYGNNVLFCTYGVKNDFKRDRPRLFHCFKIENTNITPSGQSASLAPGQVERYPQTTGSRSLMDTSIHT